MSEFQQVGLRNRRMATRRRRSTAQQWLNELLMTQLGLTGDRLHVVDLGGGTGGTAAALAEAGHTVLVVDPSPDALAATERRAAELGLEDRLSAVQGDTTTLTEVVPPGSVDVIVCHLVLEQRAGTVEALRVITEALRPGGLLSVVIAQRLPRVLKQAMGGNLDAAFQILGDPDLLDRPTLLAMLADGNWRILSEHGIGVIADHVPEVTVEGHADELLELEAAVAGIPTHLESATRLHVLATRD